MTNKEKFLELISEVVSGTMECIKERIQNRPMLRESQEIALKVLIKLDELGWSRKDLSKTMGVTPFTISKILSGKENLTIQTLIKLQNTLDIPILASYYENKMTPTEVLKILKNKIDSASLNKYNYVIETSDIELINQALLK